MHAYIAKRILMVIPTMIMVTMLIFVILRLIPGDPALVLLHEDLARGGAKDISQEEIQAMQVKLGTDKPIVEQYGRWVWNMLQLDFGKSYRHENEIWDELRDKFPVTLELTVLSLLMATIVAVPLGAISAIKQDTLVDYATRVITIAGIALPIFWVGTLIVFFLVLLFNWFPPLGYVELWEDPWANVQQLFLPALALGFSNMAFIARVTRSSMLEVFREDYIRTARSKGLAEQAVIFRHALRNAALPVVTVFGYQFGQLIGGTVIIETIFLLPGMGSYLITGVFNRDYATVQAVVVVITATVLLLNMVLDLIYAWLNPRIRYT